MDDDDRAHVVTLVAGDGFALTAALIDRVRARVFGAEPDVLAPGRAVDIPCEAGRRSTASAARSTARRSTCSRRLPQDAASACWSPTWTARSCARKRSTNSPARRRRRGGRRDHPAQHGRRDRFRRSTPPARRDAPRPPPRFPRRHPGATSPSTPAPDPGRDHARERRHHRTRLGRLLVLHGPRRRILRLRHPSFEHAGRRRRAPDRRRHRTDPRSRRETRGAARARRRRPPAGPTRHSRSATAPTDLAMLAAAGLGIGYRPKPVVAAAIAHRVEHADLLALLYAKASTTTRSSRRDEGRPGLCPRPGSPLRKRKGARRRAPIALARWGPTRARGRWIPLS